MRFAITAFDIYQDVFETLLAIGWEPVKLFTSPGDWGGGFASTRNVITRARQRKIPIQLSRMETRDMQDLKERGCDILVGAGYEWRIGDWRPYLPYAVNFHPSPLPQARGAYPAVRAILEDMREWAVTCHKFDQEFDTGDILAQETFPLSPNECHESLLLKTQMASRRLVNRVAGNFHDLWNNAAPQGEGSYWNRWTEQERTIDFSRSVAEILRQQAAFGLLETLANVSGLKMHVRRAVGWTEEHGHAPGSLLHHNGRSMVIAAGDGCIGLIEWSFMAEADYRVVGR